MNHGLATCRPIGAALGAALLLAATGCGSPIVGASCRSDLAQCENVCVDLQQDIAHCGACGIACSAGELCVSGACQARIVNPGDGGELPDAAGDGLPETSMLGHDSSAGDASSSESAGPCNLGETRCGSGCVRPATDRDNCGGCGVACPSDQVCDNGACAVACSAPRTQCGGSCFDLSQDPDHCGACDMSCSSGLCTDGVCSGGVAGHVVVAGHDFSSSRGGMRRLLGNALFLANGAPVRTVAYEGLATAASISGTNSALDEAAVAIGRSWTRSVVSAEEVPLRLAGADAFLVYAQAMANDAGLIALAEAWSTALGTFVKRGGVVVVLDGKGTNNGTFQVLSRDLFAATGHSPIDGAKLEVMAPSDAVSLGVPLAYRAEPSTVRIDTTDDTVVVSDGMGPVVVHRVVLP